MPEDPGGLGAYQVEQVRLPLLGRERGESCRRSAVAGGGLRGGGGRPGSAAHQAAQERRQRPGQCAQPSEGQLHGDQYPLLAGDGGVEQGQAVVGGHRDGTTAHDAVEVVLVEPPGHAGAFRPQTPGQGDGVQSVGPAVQGQRVQEAVGGCVVGLTRVAEGASGGREENEVRLLADQFMQIQGTVDLGGEHPVELFGGEGFDGAVVDDARGVDDGGEGVLVGDAGEQCGEGVAVGDVAGGEGDGGAKGGQLGDEFRRAFGVGPAAAGEEQVADTVGGDQMAGDERAQPPGGAGHQYGARHVEGGGGALPGHPAQSGRQQRVASDRELRLIVDRKTGERRRDVGVRVGSGVGVDEDEAAGVLRLGGAHQAPHSGLHQVGGLRAGADRPAGQHGQAGVGEAVLGQPLPHQAEDLARSGPDGGGHVVGRPVAVVRGDAHRHHVRQLGTERGRGREDRTEVPAQQAPDTRRGVGGDGRPRRREEGIAQRVRGPAQRLGRDRAQGQRGHLGHGGAGPVGDGERERVGPGPGEAHAERGRTGPVQGDPAPGEGEPPLFGVGQQPHGVQGGVEQGGMQAVVCSRLVGFVGEPEFGVDGVAVPPGGPQALEHRAVLHAVGGEPFVGAAQVHGRGAGRRPRGEVRRRVRLVGGEGAGDVAGPGLVRGSGVGPAVDGDATASRGARSTDAHLHDGVVLRGEDQRGCEGEVFEMGTAGLVPGADGEFEEGGAGEEGGAVDGVIGEPGVALESEYAGERQGVLVCQRQDRAEQGVAGGA